MNTYEYLNRTWAVMPGLGMERGVGASLIVEDWPEAWT